MKKPMKKIVASFISQSLLTALIGAGTWFISGQTGLSAAPQWVTWETSSGGNGHHYLAVPGSSGLTWNIANQLAQGQGGYLATITSQAENDFVFSLINSPQFFTSFNGSGPAIGGFQSVGAPEPGGGWNWVTGEAWNYTNWLPGSPDNGNGFFQENRVHFFSNTHGSSTPASTWNDINADDSNIGGYVIEVVPEPGSLTILGCASFLFARRFRGKRK